VPSDLEDSSSCSHMQPPTPPLPVPLAPPIPRKSSLYSPGRIDRPTRVQFSPEHAVVVGVEEELEELSNIEEEEDQSLEVTTTILNEFVVSRDSVFRTPGTQCGADSAGTGTSGNSSRTDRSLDYHSLPMREIQVDIHRLEAGAQPRRTPPLLRRVPKDY